MNKNTTYQIELMMNKALIYDIGQIFVIL